MRKCSRVERECPIYLSDRTQEQEECVPTVCGTEASLDVENNGRAWDGCELFACGKRLFERKSSTDGSALKTEDKDNENVWDLASANSALDACRLK